MDLSVKIKIVQIMGYRTTLGFLNWLEYNWVARQRLDVTQNITRGRRNDVDLLFKVGRFLNWKETPDGKKKSRNRVPRTYEQGLFLYALAAQGCGRLRPSQSSLFSLLFFRLVVVPGNSGWVPWSHKIATSDPESTSQFFVRAVRQPQIKGKRKRAWCGPLL